MVAFLMKPEGSEGFYQIVYFLNSTYIKYALTKNPTVYVSLIHQFWQTASISTSENGEIEITATIDRRVKTVTEASIRRHLMLEDSDGISTFPHNGGKEVENRIKSSKARRRVRLIVSKDEDLKGRHDMIWNLILSLLLMKKFILLSLDHSIAMYSKLLLEKTKLQLEQERLGYEEALRLQEQLDEEERQRIAIVHEEANTFNVEE
ncbi:hypothetical protein Tco_0760411 [Tanacetum coccineum]